MTPAKTVSFRSHYHADVAEILSGLVDVAGAEAAGRFADAAAGEVDKLRKAPEIGRRRADVGCPQIRSTVLSAFPKYVLFYEYEPAVGELVIVRLIFGGRDLAVALG